MCAADLQATRRTTGVVMVLPATLQRETGPTPPPPTTVGDPILLIAGGTGPDLVLGLHGVVTADRL